jgi:hypothetical protein
MRAFAARPIDRNEKSEVSVERSERAGIRYIDGDPRVYQKLNHCAHDMMSFARGRTSQLTAWRTMRDS